MSMTAVRHLWALLVPCGSCVPAEVPDVPAPAEVRPDPPEPSKPADAAVPAEATPPPPDPFVLETRVEPYGTFVDIHPVGAELPAWDLRPEQPSLRLRWDKARPLKEQVITLSEMLERLHATYGPTLTGASVHADLSNFGYPEYAEALGRHAAQDPAWSEKPRLHDYIVNTTRAQPLHPELNEIFASIDRRPRLEGIEKCTVARPSSRTDAGRWLLARKVTAKRPVPIGCLSGWFSLQPIEGGEQVPATSGVDP